MCRPGLIEVEEPAVPRAESKIVPSAAARLRAFYPADGAQARRKGRWEPSPPPLAPTTGRESRWPSNGPLYTLGGTAQAAWPWPEGGMVRPAETSRRVRGEWIAHLQQTRWLHRRTRRHHIANE